MYFGWATATEAAAVGVAGALILALSQGSLSWKTFGESLMGATRTSAMIALILMGAAFLSLSMGFTGLPRALANYIDTLNLSPVTLIAALTFFYIILGMFLDESTLKTVVEKLISDEQLVNAAQKFPIQPPATKEEYYYRSLFSEHFPSDTAAKCVPQEPSVACSTKIALEWDEAFKSLNEPSGRAISKVHDDAY